ncbi:MAG: S8 family peptidase [Gemmatimonadales bacterium]|nr:S8 family peptidase [Gemmatimonadales bacterium]
MSELSHLRLEGTATAVQYTYAGGGGTGVFRLPPRDRVPHAHLLKANLQQVEDDERRTRQAQGLAPDGTGTVVSVRSNEGFDLKIDSLERLQSGIELLSVKDEGTVKVAKVFVPRGKFIRLLGLVDAYENKLSPRSGQPRNRELIESIASIRLAAVRDLWQDSITFPDADEDLWWEVWLRASPGAEPSEAHTRFAVLARSRGMRVSDQFVAFPERVVTQAYGRQEQLSGSLDLLAMLAELRRAKELATDYRELTPREQAAFVHELAGRLVPPGNNAPAVCILDSGVNRGHPLLAPALAPADVQSVKPEWGTADDQRQHGTEMAGIALYGCLTQVLPATGQVPLGHRLESVKILPPPPDVNDPRDYGPFTIQAVSRAEIEAPDRNRAVCMAVTADDRDLGMPSLWSAAVDQLCAGGEGDTNGRLMFISAGNLRDEILQPAYDYHRWNCERGGIEDPGQAWNAVTVGAFTEKVFIRDDHFNGWEPVAESGDLCPTSRTSLPWPPESRDGWPIKPDIVMEGGNYARRGTDREGIDDLSLLTTVLSPSGQLLETTRDTSPATAAASRMAAIIWSQYPRLWAETVRGLLVHSARWTQKMIQRFPDNTKAVIQERLRCYGYGVPELQRALWSAENCATLLYEGELQPYQRVDGTVRTNEMHVHRVPWPVDLLQDLADEQVTLRVTLSYFVEPSPGRIGWTRKHRYQSHGLRFDVNRPVETEDAFRQRLSREEWDDPDTRPDNAAETRDWVVGDQGRRHGSIHSDWWTGNAADLAATSLIAVYPVTGWWRERPHLGRFNSPARYSLIVTIETANVEVDLYTPIVNQATILTELER